MINSLFYQGPLLAMLHEVVFLTIDTMWLFIHRDWLLIMKFISSPPIGLGAVILWALILIGKY